MNVDWTSNHKTLICDDCPYGDERSQCLVSGIPDRLATLTFVIEKPQEGSVQRQRPLQDRDGGVFKHLLTKAQEKVGDSPPYQVVYAVGKAGRYKPKKAAVTTCNEYATQKLISHRQNYERSFPGDKKLHVLVTMGATATRAFLPHLKNMNKSRGKPIKVDIRGHDFYVVPTMGISHVNVQPGIVPLVKRDIAYALQLCRRSQIKPTISVEEITNEYVIPRSKEELYAVTEEILNYTDPEKRPDPDTWPISVDTETNTLDPWRSDAKVIMVSVAWDDRKSTAICLHHADSPYPLEDARECIGRIMASKKPKVFHNLKFDYQFLVHCEKFEVNNLWWDTLLGEHFLDEDKRGFYGLDALAKSYCPEYDGYKKQIQASLIEKVKEDMLEGVDQTRPDPAQSYILSPFFPDVEYHPACEREGVHDLLDDEKLNELFGYEKDYIEAHIAGKKKPKNSARGKVRRRCKKWGIDPPDTISDRNYEKELEGKGFSEIPLDVLLVYAATDTDVTRIACKKQMRRAHKQKALHQMKKVMAELMVPASVELGKMEFKGTYVNREEMRTSYEDICKAEAKHLDAMRDLVCDMEFNPNSDQQLGRIVSITLPVDVDDLEETRTGQISVTADWIEAMADKYSDQPQGEFFNHLLVYRACTKARGFIEKFEELAEHDGRLHPTFWLNGTKTGRLSCRNPNMQQVPMWMGRFQNLGYSGWNIKQPLTVDTPETHAFWQMDISQAEVRVLCAYSRDPDLIQAMCDGLDVHSFITAKVFGMTYEEVYNGKDTDPDIKHKRGACKRVVFGTLYGAGVAKIAEQIYGTLSDDAKERDDQISFAADVRNTLFNRFSRIRTYVTKTQREAHVKGYVDTFFGRRRRFSLRNASSKHKYKAEREAVNFRIQSTSSDIVLAQLVEVGQNIDALDATMLLTVHDSMGGEVPLNRVGEMKQFFDHYIVDRVKDKFPWLPVPFAYDLEVGPSYGEPIDYDLVVMPVRDMNNKMKSKYDSLSDRKQAFHSKIQAAL